MKNPILSVSRETINYKALAIRLGELFHDMIFFSHSVNSVDSITREFVTPRNRAIEVGLLTGGCIFPVDTNNNTNNNTISCDVNI